MSKVDEYNRERKMHRIMGIYGLWSFRSYRTGGDVTLQFFDRDVSKAYVQLKESMWEMVKEIEQS